MLAFTQFTSSSPFDEAQLLSSLVITWEKRILPLRNLALSTCFTELLYCISHAVRVNTDTILKSWSIKHWNHSRRITQANDSSGSRLDSSYCSDLTSQYADQQEAVMNYRTIFKVVKMWRGMKLHDNSCRCDSLLMRVIAHVFVQVPLTKWEHFRERTGGMSLLLRMRKINRHSAVASLPSIFVGLFTTLIAHCNNHCPASLI